MKKIGIIAALVLSSALAQNTWVSSILNPSVDERVVLCDEVFNATTNNKTLPSFDKHYALLSASPRILFQTVQGSVYSVCNSRAKALDNKPQASALSNVPLILWVYGRVTELDDARRWAAVLVLYDASGNEIYRLRYDPTGSELGNTKRWDVSCSSRPCTWSGSNIYYFYITNEALAKVNEASSFGIVVSRGRGIESFRIEYSQYTSLR